MPSYDNDLVLTELATGEGSGTWGDTTNVNLELIGEAFSYGTEATFDTNADKEVTIDQSSHNYRRIFNHQYQKYKLLKTFLYIGEIYLLWLQKLHIVCHYS